MMPSELEVSAVGKLSLQKQRGSLFALLTVILAGVAASGGVPVCLCIFHSVLT